MNLGRGGESLFDSMDGMGKFRSPHKRHMKHMKRARGMQKRFGPASVVKRPRRRGMIYSGLRGVDYPIDAGSDDQSLPGEARINQFNEWLAERFPEKYATLKSKHPELFQYRSDATGFYGLGAQPIQATESPIKWAQLASDAIKGVFAYKTQQQLLKLNIERAGKGLPPVEASAIAPTVKVEGGLSNKTLLLGAAALGVLLLIMRKR